MFATSEVKELSVCGPDRYIFISIFIYGFFLMSRSHFAILLLLPVSLSLCLSVFRDTEGSVSCVIVLRNFARPATHRLVNNGVVIDFWSPRFNYHSKNIFSILYRPVRDLKERRTTKRNCLIFTD